MHIRPLKALIYLLLLAAPVLACDKECYKGCEMYSLTANQVVCACAEIPVTGEPVKPSDEKPRMSGQPVEQVMVIDKAKPAEATDDGLDALAAKTARQTDRELAAREKALGIK